MQRKITPEEKKQAAAMGRFLCKIRTEHGLTQGQIHEYLGIAQTTLSSIEAGKSFNISVIKLAALARFLGVPLESILEEAGILSQTTDEQKTAFDRFFALAKADPRVYSVMLSLLELPPQDLAVAVRIFHAAVLHDPVE